MIGAEIGVSGAVVYRLVVKGIEPKRADLRRALGLPVLAPAPVCPNCQVPHVTKRCPNKRRQVPAWVEQAVAWLRAREK